MNSKFDITVLSASKSDCQTERNAEIRYDKEPPIKDFCSQEEGRFVQCGHFADNGGGFFQMRTSAFFGAKKI